MQPTFSIQDSQTDPATARLIIETGPMGFSFVVLDETNCFTAVTVYHFPAGLEFSSLPDILDKIISGEPLLKQQYKITSIIWAFFESILVPPAFIDRMANAEILHLIFGDLQPGRVLTDFIYTQNLHNVYRLPIVVSDNMAAHFPNAIHTHQYSLLPGNLIKQAAHFTVICYTQSLTVQCSRNGALLLVRNYVYHTPEDAVYHILNLCESFEIKPEDVVLHLSGMIEADSNLYKALYKYFLNIEWETLPADATYISAIKNKPPHYFSHLFVSALCV